MRMNYANVNRAISVVIVFALAFGALAVSAPSAKAELAEMVNTVGALPEERVYPTAVEIDGSIYLFGGFVADLYGSIEASLDTVLIYDIATGETTMGTEMTYGVALSQSAVGDDGLVYVFGGYNSTYSYITSVQIYDPASDTWTDGAAAPLRLGGAQAVSGPDGKFYLFGAGLWSSTNSTLIYDSVLDSWSYGSDQPFDGGIRGAVLLNDTSILVCGGQDTFVNVVVDYAEIYDISTDTFTGVSTMPQASNFGGAALARNGMAYFLGGTTGDWIDSGTVLSTIQVYDPVSDEWWESAYDSLPSGRAGFATVTDEYGRIFVIGGYNGASTVSSVVMIVSADIALDNMRIISPYDGAVVSGDVVVTVSITNINTYATAMDFYVDSELMETQFLTFFISADWIFVWDTNGVLDGSTHELWVRAYMFDGSIQEASVTVTYSAYSVEERLAMLENQIASLGVDLSDLQYNLSVLQDSVDAQALDIVALQDAIDAVQAEMALLSADIVALSSDVDDMDQANADRIAALEDSLADLESSVDDLMSALSTLENSTSDVQSSVDNKMDSVLGFAVIGLLVVVILLLIVMMMSGRKSEPPPPSA